VRLLQAPGYGAGAARNAGAAAAAGEVIAFTDADCFPQPDWLRQGLAAIAGADLVQGRVTPDPGAPSHPLQRTLWVVEESGLYETANLFLDRSAFERSGGFEEVLDRRGGRPIGEDTWLGWRIRRAGGSTRFCAEALVHHAVFRSTLAEKAREGARRSEFPALVAMIPELRETLLWHRRFLSRRSALTGLAAAGLLAAALARSGRPLALTLPYICDAGQGKAGWRRHAPLALAGEVAHDFAGLAGLLRGSVRTGTLVL
jgi:GT2 family glycosyltransferase